MRLQSLFSSLSVLAAVPRRTVLQSGASLVTLSMASKAAFADDGALPKTGGYTQFCDSEP